MKAKLTTHDARSRKLIFSLPAGETVVGRGEDCDLRLSDSRVSRHHCRLVLIDGLLRVIDLSSTNGTFVNGRAVQEATLDNGDRLAVGRINLTVESEPDAGDATRAGVEADVAQLEDPLGANLGLSDDPCDDTATGVYVATDRQQPSSHVASEDPQSQLARRQAASSALPAQATPPGNVFFPSAPAGQPGADQRSLGRILRCRRTIIAVALLIAVPALLAIWTLIEPQYLAVGQVRVRPIIPHLVFKIDESGTIPFYQSYLNTQVGVMRSPTVLQRALDQADVQDTAWYKSSEPFWRAEGTKLERLREDLTVEPRGMTELIDVSVSATSGRDSAVIVNAVLGQYIKYLSETSDEGADMMFRQLVKQYRLLETEIRGRQEMIAKLRKHLGTGDPRELVSQRRVRLDQTLAGLNSVRRTLAMAKLRRKDLRERLNVAESPPENEIGGLASKPQQHDDPEWSRLSLAAKRARHEVDLARQRLGYAHPKLLALEKQAKFAEELLASRERQLTERWRLYPPKQLGPVVHPGVPPVLALELEDTEWQVKLLSYEEKLMDKDLNKQKSSWESTFDRAQILDVELSAIRQKRRLYDAVRNRLEQKRMERNVPGSIEVLARAVVPALPARDRRAILTVLSLMASLAAGLTAAFLRASSDSSIHHVEEFRQATGVPFLGQLPGVEVSADRTPFDDPILDEGIRMVRTSLLQQLSDRGGNIVLITSAEPGVGKTTVAAMLARSLARCGKRALLVDADMRSPSVAQQMGLHADVGFTDILAGHVDDDDAILETEYPRLSVLPGGQAGKRFDPELITNGNFTKAVARWRLQYDVVLLDSPPLLPVADARILAQHADGTILVAWAERTKRAELLEAIGYLDLAGGKLWGTVFIRPRGKGGYEGEYDYQYGPDQE